MDPGDILELSAVLLSVTLSVAVGAGAIRLIWAYASRVQRGPTVDQLSDRDAFGDEIARRDVQIQQLEERVDFLERALASLPQSKSAEAIRQRPKETTPV